MPKKKKVKKTKKAKKIKVKTVKLNIKLLIKSLEPWSR